MKKFLILIIVLCANTIFSDDHGNSNRNGHEMHTFVHLSVTDPAAVVAAMDKFMSSDCGKNFPADIGLMAEMINGSSPSTHFHSKSWISPAHRSVVLTCSVQP